MALKMEEYALVKDMAPPTAQKPVAPAPQPVTIEEEEEEKTTIGGADVASQQQQPASLSAIVDHIEAEVKNKPAADSMQLTLFSGAPETPADRVRNQLITRQRERMLLKPTWHAPWKLKTVISGHLGWVRACAVEPGNEWFVTGSADRTIKIWDLASGSLKLTLTGHINTVTAMAVSARSPYMFSASLDKKVLCWDLETNKVIRSYHGHLNGVYSLALHPTLDVLVSGGRDSCARVWDIRTKSQVRVLGGHNSTVGDIIAQSVEPQIVTGSHDSTIKCWDLATGKCSAHLTNHKKSVRALVAHPTEYTFASGSADNIKVWKCPEARFLRNVSGHNAIINTLAVNHDNVLVSGADNGSIQFHDWKTGYTFQEEQTIAQPGSLDSEAGVFKIVFDKTGSRMITCEADKTIKIWKEDDTATPESHPIDFKPTLRQRY